MVTDYKSRKNEVLSSYDTVEKLITELANNAKQIGMPNPTKNMDKLISDIRGMAERVREDRFTIMVAGESKSGKSTFINAYLGFEILPMDIKQCTSSIVEIKYGTEFSIRATYADGRIIEIQDQDAAQKFLKENAALDDDYRSIPVPTINSEILVKSGQRAQRKGKKISINQHEIEDLLNAPEIQEANIYNLSSDDYNQKIRNYINERKNSLQNIVTKIEVLFPLKEDMRGIEIIDSPGVCARGGVSEITTDYIKNADAIIFLKPLTGQALESTQFNRFMRNASVKTSVNRNPNALFLVLTRAADLTPADLRRQEDEAYRQFRRLDRDHILLVDSKAELYAKQFANIENIEYELVKRNKAGTLDSFVKDVYTQTNGIFADSTEHNFLQKLQEKSRFSQVYNALEKFGRKSHYILLGQLLDSICTLYYKLWNDLNSNMELFRQKAEDPKELERKIENIKKELDVIKNKMFRDIDTVTHRFNGDDGLIRVEIEKIAFDFTNSVSIITPESSDAFNELERQSMYAVDAFKKKVTELQKQMVNDFDKNLIKLTARSTISFESIRPDFTEETFNKLFKDTKSEGVDIKIYEEGVTFKKTHRESIYSQNKHFKILKDNIISRLASIKEDAENAARDFASNIRTHYYNELSKNAQAKKEELDSIMEAKLKAEQILKIIEDLKFFASSIAAARETAQKLKGGIQRNVQ